jgi:hypothetical protein
MDERRQVPLRMVECGKQALDAAERQIDALGMQRQQSRQDGADRRRIGTWAAHAGAGRLKRPGGSAAAGGADALVNSRHSRAMVARSSARCTTMSTMP